MRGGKVARVAYSDPLRPAIEPVLRDIPIAPTDTKADILLRVKTFGEQLLLTKQIEGDLPGQIVGLDPPA